MFFLFVFARVVIFIFQTSFETMMQLLQFYFPQQYCLSYVYYCHFDIQEAQCIIENLVVNIGRYQKTWSLHFFTYHICYVPSLTCLTLIKFIGKYKTSMSKSTMEYICQYTYLVVQMLLYLSIHYKKIGEIQEGYLKS